MSPACEDDSASRQPSTEGLHAPATSADALTPAHILLLVSPAYNRLPLPLRAHFPWGTLPPHAHDSRGQSARPDMQLVPREAATMGTGAGASGALSGSCLKLPSSRLWLPRNCRPPPGACCSLP